MQAVELFSEELGILQEVFCCKQQWTWTSVNNSQPIVVNFKVVLWLPTYCALVHSSTFDVVVSLNTTALFPQNNTPYLALRLHQPASYSHIWEFWFK